MSCQVDAGDPGVEIKELLCDAVCQDRCQMEGKSREQPKAGGCAGALESTESAA